MKYTNYVAQVDEADCGVAALAMILKHFKSNVSLAKLRLMARTTKEGTTAFGLARAAEQMGIEVDAYQADLDFLRKQQPKFPAIVHVIKAGLLHYYVVFKFDQDFVYIADPDPQVKVKRMSVAEFEQQWSGVCLFFNLTDQYQPQQQSEPTFGMVFKSLLNYKRLIAQVVSVAILMTLISVVGSYYLQLLIDTIIPRQTLNLLSVITIGLLGVYLLNAFFNYGRDLWLTKLDQRLSAQIGLKYIQHVYRLPMDFFTTRKTGEITSRFSDINKIIDALSSTVISIFLDVGMMVIIGSFLFISNRLLFGITMLMLPLFILVIYLFNQKFVELNEAQMEQNAKVSSSIIEDLHGIETLKVLQLESNRYDKVATEFNDFLQKNLAYVKSSSRQNSIKIWLQSALTTIILFAGARLVINHQLSLGALMAYNTLLGFFVTPLQNVISLQVKIQQARVANRRLNEVLVVDSEPDEQNSSVTNLTGRIELADVHYAYSYADEILNGINLKLNANSKLAIVGKSGSGKSTLMKLLANFYQPTEGTIRFDDLEITDLNLQLIRQTVHYLPQTAHLFAGSIRDNLLMGTHQSVSQSLLDWACQQAMIYDDIQKMPLKYDTKLDETASVLSGGQKQRLAIARSLLSPAKVIIFDESTSALDVLTEKKLIDNLLQMQERTLIFVAHRLAIAKRMPQIVVLDQGKVIEQGTHESLLKQNGLYHSLWNA